MVHHKKEGDYKLNQQEIIKQCQLEDMQAFNALFELYGSKAYRTAFLIVGRKDLAEDIVQEAFIQCFREIKHLRNPLTFQAWFYRIVVRLSWQISSKERKHSKNECFYPLGSSTYEDLTEHLEKREASKSLEVALGKLDKNLRTTIVLFYFNEFSIKHISKIMNCFEGTVKSRLYTARKRLAKELITESSQENKLYEKECRINV